MQADTVIAVSATVIALGSFWANFTEVRSTRSHNRQSVRPLLQIRRARSYEDQITGIKVINAGLGPAIVTKTVVQLDGEVIGQWNLQTYRHITAPLPMKPKVLTLFQGVPLLAGQSQFLLHIDNFNPDQHAWFWELISERLTIEIFYESLYGGENFKAVTPPL